MIGFVGLSHLGLNTSIGLAGEKFPILGIDLDQNLVAQLNQEKLPLYEPGLAEKLKQDRDYIEFSSETQRLAECDLVYFACDIKTDENNRSDTSQLEELLQVCLPRLKPNTSVVIHSQVLPGFCRGLEEKIKKLGLHLFYQVEVLIFGRAIERVTQPERYIVGCADPTAELPATYKNLLEQFNVPVLKMRYESAELSKLSINMYLAASVCVTNSIAEVAESIGADWKEIFPVLQLDKRIGKFAYLQTGLGISGGNLERDLESIDQLAMEHGCFPEVFRSFVDSSAYSKNWPLRKLYEQVLSSTSNPRICILGVAYKPDTTSVKNSPSVQLIESLPGVTLRAHDPQAKYEKSQKNFKQYDSIKEALKESDALVIMTNWQEYKELGKEEIQSLEQIRTIIDPYGVLEPQIDTSKHNYFRLGCGN